MIIKDFNKKENDKIIIFKGCNNSSNIRLRRLKRFKRSIDQITSDLESIL